MNNGVLTVIIATVSMSALAQVAFKMGVSSLPVKSGALVTVMLQAAMSPLIWLGLAIYGISVLTWLWVLSKVDVSVAYPFVGISFVLTVGIGALFLHENVSPLRWFGTLLVVGGCIVIARSA
jgi:drug/metabolite transporter (DMT)-like permease